MRSPRILLAGWLVAAGVVPAHGQIVRLSVSTTGTEANEASYRPSISADGRFVVFDSDASNLVAGDTNGTRDVFLRDRDTDADGVLDEPGAVATTAVSVAGSVTANGPSWIAGITPDGRYVTFVSSATNLVAGSTLPANIERVYRYDRASATMLLVSVSSEGQPGGHCRGGAVSDNGQVFVMRCEDPPIAPGDLGFGGGIFVRDLSAGTTVRVSDIQPPGVVDPGPLFTSYLVVSPAISGDGRYVAFVELVNTQMRTGPVTSRGSVVLVDRVTATTRRNVAAATTVALTQDGTAILAQLDPGTSAPSPLYRQTLSNGARLEAGGLLSAVTDVSADGRTLLAGRAFYDLVYGQAFDPITALGIVDLTGGRLSGSGRHLAFQSADTSLVGGDTNGVPDVFVLGGVDTLFDGDADALDDRWETFFGLSTTSAGGEDGPAGDPDGDGVSNAQEQAAGSHPRGLFRRYLAEGAAGPFFRTRIAAVNPDSLARAAAVLEYLRSDGSTVSRPMPVAAGRRTTREPGEVEGLAIADVSTVIESDRPLVVDRLMAWDAARYGSHAETAITAPAATWFLAEGTTVLGFQLFYLLQNPQATATAATVRYLLPSGAPRVRTYELPARSRTTIYVNTVPGLGQTDVSAEITATQPIVVERAMYRSRDGQAFALGHAAAGVAQASPAWFLAEGATGSFFDTYILVANPSPEEATVQLDFLRDDGTVVSRTHRVAAESRFSVYVDGVPGMEATSFGTRIIATVPIVVERAMYWAGGYFDYYEGHASAAATATGSRWLLAEGELRGPAGAETYVLIANVGAAPVLARVSLLSEGSGFPALAVPVEVTVPANGRVSVPLGSLLHHSAGMFAPVLGGADVREIAPTPAGTLVVEGAIYWNANGQLWGAGASLPATRVP